MENNKSILFKSDHLTVVLSEHGSDCVFVTFNEMGLRANGFRFWGDGLFDSLKLTSIGFVSSSPDWYAPDDMEPAAKACSSYIKARRVVTYGYSQGGYGALKYSRLLSADLALSFSPQWSINPADVGDFDRRFTQHYDAERRNGERIEAHDLCSTCYIVVDPGEPGDFENARHLLRLPGTHLIQLPFCGHETIRVVAEGRAGRALISLCQKHDIPPTREFRQVLRHARGRSQTYARHKVRQLSRSLARHRRFAERALAQLPEGPNKVMTAVEVALLSGGLNEAKSLMGSLSDVDLLSLNFLERWHLFRRTGFSYGEQRLGGLYRVRYPDNPFARLHGANSLIFVGEVERGVHELLEIERLPGAPDHIRTFISLYGQAGCLDRASEFRDRLGREGLLPISAQIRVSFDIIEVAKRLDIRPQMFRELRKMRELHEDGACVDMLRVSGLFFEIGETEYARACLPPAGDLDNPDALHLAARIEAKSDRRRKRSYLGFCGSKRGPMENSGYDCPTLLKEFWAPMRLLRLLKGRSYSKESRMRPGSFG
ncbi:MAG: hypothetical protein JO270_04075 [Acidobacteriaceae bacterium]|nr:hypothetical protein [Acidobacteriaceae bacterium]